MKLKEFHISLDIKKYNKTDYFEVVQGDLNSNVLNITLVDGLNPYDLTGTNVEIVFAKPDRTTVIQDNSNGVVVINELEGKIQCTLNTNTIASPGKVVAEVRVLSDIDDMLLTSTRFGFYVRKAIFGDDTIKSTNEWPLLKKLLAVSEEESIRQSNEEERIQNEQTREDNEEQRIVKETERNVAESVRINSEDERIANEEARRTNEQNRQSNEAARIEEENIRQSNEVTRNEKEDIRISQEESRVLAEESRESNEAIRQQNESRRESNETIRISNEDERELNESNRVSAETDRVQAEITRQEGYNQAIDNFSTDSTQAINDFNTQGQQAINDFVTETERVEAIYPTRLTNVENDLAQHKLDYVSQRQQDQLKVAKVEKDINDYKQVMSQVNINQEAKQKVTGYGTISLPKNAANGQVSVSMKGNTEVDDEGNTKSTISASRLKSVGKNLFDLKQETGLNKEIINLDGRSNVWSMPNYPFASNYFIYDRYFEHGMVYTLSLDTKYKVGTKRGLGVNVDYTDNTRDFYYKESASNWIRVTQVIGDTNKQIKMIRIGRSANNEYSYIDLDTIQLEKGAGATPYEPYKESTSYVVAKDKDNKIVNLMSHEGVHDEIDLDKRELIKRIGVDEEGLTYQLAEPVEIPIQTSGSLVSYPSGTVYIEPFVADAGIYTDKMEVLYSDLPIKTLEKISKVDFDTGLETELDITAAVIAEDKLSFTHPDLVDGDIVFFTYEYDRESTEGETEIEYYDSRYVIQDSVTGKFYKWKIAVANGTPTIELEEV